MKRFDYRRWSEQGWPSLVGSQPMSRAPSRVRNVTTSWLGMALGIMYAFAVTPVVVQSLDTKLYGAWQFVNGLLVYSELLYLGLGSAVIRYVAQARLENDMPRINRLMSVVFSIYTAIGLFCFAALVSISPWVPLWLPDPLPPEAGWAVSITCGMLGFRLLLAFVCSSFSGLLAGYDRFDITNAIGIVLLVVRFVAIFVFLPHASNALITLAAIVCGFALIETVVIAVVAYLSIPGLFVRAVLPRPDELKILYGFGLASFFVLFSFKLISYTDTSVIGFRLGLNAVALYSLPLQLVEYARICVGAFSGVLLPRLTQLAAKGELAALREEYLSSARIASFISGWLGALVIALGPAFLTRWVGSQFGAASGTVLFWLTIAAFAQALSTQVPYPFYQSLHVLGFPAIVLTVEALANLGLSIWLAPRMGIEGVALASAIPAVFVSAILLPSYLCKRLQLPLRSLLLAGVVPGVLMLTITLAAEMLVARVHPGGSYGSLVLRALVSVPIAALLFGLLFPREQHQALAAMLPRPFNSTV